MHKYILAIDQSTSATKVMLFSDEAALLFRASVPHRQYYPRPGFVEHDAAEIFENVLKGINNVIDHTGISPKDIAITAITNQRETAVIWDRYTGKPVAPAAVWQCLRGEEYCSLLRREGCEKMIREKTGLVIDPYFSAGKLHWIMNHNEGLKAKAENGQLLWGTMDSWLLWNLTGGSVHATDHSNACRTMLFNINTLEWDSDLAELFGLHPSMFPEVRFSDEIFGYSEPSMICGESIAVGGLMGDSHAALFGQNCFDQGMAKATYGTGSSVMMNIGGMFRDAPRGLVTSIGYSRGGRVDYVFEGNIHSTGDTIKWLQEGLQLISGPVECEELALSVEGNGGVYLVPAFTGLGAPYWDNSVRASITGMRRDTTKAHVARAALESIAYQIKDLVDLMESGGDIKLTELRVDGGPAGNDFLMQFQSDILQRKLVRANIEEISALGSVFMAGLAAGLWSSLEEIRELRHHDRIFEPGLDEKVVKNLYSGWKRAVSKTRGK